VDSTYKAVNSLNLLEHIFSILYNLASQSPILDVKGEKKRDMVDILFTVPHSSRH
jgi:hypothetical protein